MRALILAFLLATAGTASAQPAQPPASSNPQALDQVYRCAAITDNAQRLACFDSAVSTLQAAQNSGQIVAVDREQVRTIRRDSFGFNLPSLASLLPHFGGGNRAEAEPALERVELQLQRVVPLADGRYRFVMANGQVWVDIESGHTTARAGDTVVIRSALAGSFLLTPPRGGGARRVRRES